jgi:hypothetical protein
MRDLRNPWNVENVGGDNRLKPNALRKLANGSLRILPFEEIDNRVRSGAYQFHDFGTCWVWTEITEYQTETVLQVLLLVGDGFEERKAEVVAGLEKFGAAHGCAAIEALCRLGLERSLKPQGFKRKKVLLRKDING